MHPMHCVIGAHASNWQTYNVLWATMEQYLKQGLISDSKVLDIRQVDVSSTVARLQIGSLNRSTGIHGQDPRE